MNRPGNPVITELPNRMGSFFHGSVSQSSSSNHRLRTEDESPCDES